MKLFRFLRHLFIPHDSNNQKAKLLHSSSLITIAIFVVAFQYLLSFFPKISPSVLGYAANISSEEVIRLTNQQRVSQGLSTLSENRTLDQAAQAKGNDMLAKGYWAHFAPDGTSPWSFFISFGYKYKYAGENLARDFPDAQSAVTAWMNSPSHRENLLNPNYKEIGIGVVEGNLAGTNTTIIVQFFGSPLIGTPAIPVANAQSQTQVQVTQESTPAPVVLQASPTPVAKIMSNVVVSPFLATKNISLGVTGLLLLVLSIDLIVVRRRKIVRIGGRTLAHIAYFGMILAVVLILKAGQII